MENTKDQNCNSEGCPFKPFACYLPGEDKPNEYLCATHAQEEGYCFLCGNYSAGMQGFDIWHPGMCDNCYEQTMDEL